MLHPGLHNSHFPFPRESEKMRQQFGFEKNDEALKCGPNITKENLRLMFEFLHENTNLFELYNLKLT